ncbi:MAG: DUF456 domain-containing protein [Alistipes sp.]|nr:DUF456 domain-containing protein [Alistipes sp.]
MNTILAIIAVICGVVGCIGCIVPILPGVLLSYIGYICLYFVSGVEVSMLWLIIFGVLTLIVTALDYILPAYMTKRFGGTKAGEWGATIGVVAGIFFGPLGVIVAPFVGAMVGELIHDSRDTQRALKSGWGSFVSFLVGTGIKLAVSLWITFDIGHKVWDICKSSIENWF